jgi:hypothetical protein
MRIASKLAGQCLARTTDQALRTSVGSAPWERGHMGTLQCDTLIWRKQLAETAAPPVLDHFDVLLLMAAASPLGMDERHVGQPRAPPHRMLMHWVNACARPTRSSPSWDSNLGLRVGRRPQRQCSRP